MVSEQITGTSNNSMSSNSNLNSMSSKVNSKPMKKNEIATQQ